MPDEIMDGQEEDIEQDDSTEEVEDQQAEIDAVQGLWEQVAPDLAEHIADLATEAREEILLKRLAAKPDSSRANGDETDSEVAEGRGKGRKPSAAEVPQFNAEELAKAGREAFENGDYDAFETNLRKSFTALNSLAVLVHESLEEQGVQLGEMYKEAVRPTRIKRAMAKVSGAVDGDVAEAERIYDSGEATTPEAALSLAVFRRLQTTGVTRRTANARRSAGIAAGRASSGPRKSGAAVQGLPVTQDEWEAVLQKEWDAKQKR